VPQTAKNSGITGVIWLFSQIAESSAAKVSAEDEMSIADKSLQKQQNSQTRGGAAMLCMKGSEQRRGFKRRDAGLSG
jgi:hypothetical protein